MEIRVTRRFKKAYSVASPNLQLLAEGAVRDFVHRQRSSPKTVLRNYDRLARLSEPVIEIDLAGGPRLLAHYARESLLLLDMGSHDVVKHYDINKFRHDIEQNMEAPRQFWPETKQKFFVRFDAKMTPSIKYESEVKPEWVYFLEDQQQVVFNEIGDAFLSGQYQTHFLMGGPGTGKTCILLNLLKFFVDLDFAVGISISNDLVLYLEAATGLNISQYRVNGLSEYRSLDLILVDDPPNIDFNLLEHQHTAKTVVFAFDPLQLSDDFTDGHLNYLVSKFGARHHSLDICYRQKANVGKTSKHVIDQIALSTPFLRPDKIESFRQERQGITLLSNQLQFVNPHGYSTYYPKATVSDLKNEVKRILDHPWLMWKHWPGLLILTENELSKEANAVLNRFHGGYVKIMFLGQVEKVKGLEFQHVFVIINENLFEQLQHGFEGSGQKTYHARRLLRIPFSRAKDSLVVFAMGRERNA
jgi:hypothetical protein